MNGLFGTQHPPYIPQTPQPKPIPPSKILPRGYRRPRKPKDIPPVHFDENFNFPTLNEMMAFSPTPVQSESQKISNTHKMMDNYKIHHNEIASEFLNDITHPHEVTPIKSTPEIKQHSVFVPHIDQPSFINGQYFSVEDIDVPEEVSSDVDQYGMQESLDTEFKD